MSVREIKYMKSRINRKNSDDSNDTNNNDYEQKEKNDRNSLNIDKGKRLYCRYYPFIKNKYEVITEDGHRATVGAYEVAEKS